MMYMYFDHDMFFSSTQHCNWNIKTVWLITTCVPLKAIVIFVEQHELYRCFCSVQHSVSGQCLAVTGTDQLYIVQPVPAQIEESVSPVAVRQFSSGCATINPPFAKMP